MIARWHKREIELRRWAPTHPGAKAELEGWIGAEEGWLGKETEEEEIASELAQRAGSGLDERSGS